MGEDQTLVVGRYHVRGIIRGRVSGKYIVSSRILWQDQGMSLSRRVLHYHATRMLMFTDLERLSPCIRGGPGHASGNSHRNDDGKHL